MGDIIQPTIGAMRTNMQELDARFRGASSAATWATSSMAPGINNDGSQVLTLGAHTVWSPTTPYCQPGLSVPIRWVCSKGHNFERRIKFILNTCFIEQEPEEMAHASLFPEGCPELEVQHSQETAVEGSVTSR